MMANGAVRVSVILLFLSVAFRLSESGQLRCRLGHSVGRFERLSNGILRMRCVDRVRRLCVGLSECQRIASSSAGCAMLGNNYYLAGLGQDTTSASTTDSSSTIFCCPAKEFKLTDCRNLVLSRIQSNVAIRPGKVVSSLTRDHATVCLLNPTEQAPSVNSCRIRTKSSTQTKSSAPTTVGIGETETTSKATTQHVTTTSAVTTTTQRPTTSIRTTVTTTRTEVTTTKPNGCGEVGAQLNQFSEMLAMINALPLVLQYSSVRSATGVYGVGTTLSVSCRPPANALLVQANRRTSFNQLELLHASKTYGARCDADGAWRGVGNSAKTTGGQRLTAVICARLTASKFRELQSKLPRI